jgi:hypothetical protein
LPEREGRGVNLDEVGRLVESIKDTIVQQNNIITSQHEVAVNNLPATMLYIA